MLSNPEWYYLGVYKQLSDMLGLQDFLFSRLSQVM